MRAHPLAQPLSRRLSLIFGVVFLAVCACGAIAWGSISIPLPAVTRILWSRLARGRDPAVDPAWVAIVMSIRLPRVVLAILVGAVLSVAGAVYQAIFRNPLADPYLIGVSSGASFGAALAIVLFGGLSLWGLGLVTLCAFSFAIVASLLSYALSRVGGRSAVTLLVLAGVALASLFSAATTLLMLGASSSFQAMEVVSWLLGSLGRSTWRLVATTLPFAAVGIVVSLAAAYRLNLLQLGEEQAQLLGVRVERLRGLLMLTLSLATAAAVSVSGVIGFVGLIIPHLVRILWGPDHRFLVPMSGLLGGALLVLADCLARSLAAPREIPLGVVTACLGVPFFLVLLRRQRRSLL